MCTLVCNSPPLQVERLRALLRSQVRGRLSRSLGVAADLHEHKTQTYRQTDSQTVRQADRLKTILPSFGWPFRFAVISLAATPSSRQHRTTGPAVTTHSTRTWTWTRATTGTHPLTHSLTQHPHPLLGTPFHYLLGFVPDSRAPVSRQLPF
jgi:hypothetical protein